MLSEFLYFIGRNGGYIKEKTILKLKTKIRIDRMAGLPLVYSLNMMARILGFFLRIDHSLKRPVKTIAVCKFVGMGSIVQAIPLLKTLRRNYPDARIIFITNISNFSLFQYIPEVNEIYCVSDKTLSSLIISNVSLLFKLWRKRPDIYIDLEIYSNYSSMIATMSLSRNRMGFFKDDKTYRMGMYTHMLYFNIKSPISETYLQFARLMECKELIHDPTFDSSLINQKDLSVIAKKLGKDFPANYIIINPNASELRLERRWPAEKLIPLIRSMLVEIPEHEIIFIGDATEKEYVHTLMLQMGDHPRLIDSSGKLSLSELVLLISNASLMVTNDTGPMHLAFAVKTPTVSLFGPCSPAQYGGKERTISIYKNVYCSPCVHEFLIPPCKGDNQCMKKISSEEVFSAVKKALASDFKNELMETDYTDASNAALGVILR
jgi:ADP-heptose:LPS heptosyltransferase